MRTKTLVLSALLGLATIGTSMAQVYSLNTVGYVNITLTNGYNLIANQLDFDGTGTNNTLATVIGTNMPNQTKVLSWNGTSWDSALWLTATKKWSGKTNEAVAALQPGKGFFIQIPAAAVTPITLTLVGNVLTGTNTVAVPVGYNMVGNRYPVSGGLQTVMGYKPTTLDKVWLWDASIQNWTSRLKTAGGWNGGEPTPIVGQPIFIQAKAATNWTQILNIVP